MLPLQEDGHTGGLMKEHLLLELDGFQKHCFSFIWAIKIKGSGHAAVLEVWALYYRVRANMYRGPARSLCYRAKEPTKSTD